MIFFRLHLHQRPLNPPNLHPSPPPSIPPRLHQEVWAQPWAAPASPRSSSSTSRRRTPTPGRTTTWKIGSTLSYRLLKLSEMRFTKNIIWMSNFQVRSLKDESDTKKKASLLKQIGAKYFTPENGIILGNNELWRRCAATCEKSSDTCHSEAEKHLCLAHDDVLLELDKMHLLFLHQRKEKTCVDKMKMCILWSWSYLESYYIFLWTKFLLW